MAETIILPGERVPADHVNLTLGPGLLKITKITEPVQLTSDLFDNDASKENKKPVIISTRAGDLKHSENMSRWWVDNNSRRYTPAPQEPVVGVVTQRLGEAYRVDIGSAHHASLDGLAFEGATKRSKPNLKVGSLVYARISLAHKDMEPELECFDAQTRKAEGFGELKGGFVVKCSLKMCRNMLDAKHFLMPMLGERFQVNAAIGMNGRVWVNAGEAKQIIAISRCIDMVDPDGGGMTLEEVKKFLGTLDI